MEKSFVGAAWVMSLVTTVTLLVVAGGAVAIAATSPAASLAQLDAWRGAVISIGALVVSATLLAGLTVARLRRGESLTDPPIDEPVDAPAPILVIDAGDSPRA